MGSADVRLRERAGSRALSIFTYGLSAHVLRSHLQGPLPPRELSATNGWAPPSSLRKAVADLCQLGVLARCESGDGEKLHMTELTAAGAELLAVADRLEQWLRQAPSGSIELESPVAAGIIRALLGGWETGIVRALAEGPLAVTELQRRISLLSDDALERRVNKMQATDLLARGETESRRRPCTATPWLRHAVAPLSSACVWDRRHYEVGSPLGAAEAKAVYLLLEPLLKLPEEVAGVCVLGMLTDRARRGPGPEVAAVTVAVRDGRVETCAYTPTADPSRWALGTPDGWLRALGDGDLTELRIRAELPALIVRSMHEALASP